jgi:plastocyanin
MRRRLTLSAALAIVAPLLVAGSGSAGAKRTVDVGDDFFSPDKLSISKGTKVAFNWIGRDEHNVTKKRGPGGGFASETTDDRGVNFQKKFKKAGTYKLVCTVHDGMKMKVQVG